MDLFPAAGYTSATEIDITDAPLAVVRHAGVTIAALTDLFDVGYGAVAHLFADGTLVPAGPALAIYYGDPMGVFDLELGFPVAAALAAPVSVDGVEVVASALPPGPAVAATYVGSYDGLGSAWGSLVSDAAQFGGAPSGVWIEAYVTNPMDTPAEELRTDLVLPITR